MSAANCAQRKGDRTFVSGKLQLNSGIGHRMDLGLDLAGCRMDQCHAAAAGRPAVAANCRAAAGNGLQRRRRGAIAV